MKLTPQPLLGFLFPSLPICVCRHFSFLLMSFLVSYEEDEVDVALGFFWLIKSK